MIKLLDWDSNFFGIKIGKVLKQKNYNNDSIKNILEEGKNEHYKCIYFEIPFNDNIKMEIPSSFHLADIKVTLNKKVGDTPINLSENITSTIQNDHLSQIESIVMEISKKSRYSLDKNFGEDMAKKLYKKWIYNSIYENYCKNHVFY